MCYPGYEDLQLVLQQALEQAAVGKGNERHGFGKPFCEQHMQTISTLLDDEHGMAYQVIKKVAEGLHLPPDARRKELLGAIVYTAGLIIWLDENRPGEPPNPYASHPTAAPHGAQSWPE